MGFRTAATAVAICASAAAFPAFADATPTTLYVAGSGGVSAGAAVDTGNCDTESTPCASLGYALSQAASGATIEISGTLYDASAVSIGQNITLAANPVGSDATIEGNGDTDGLLTIAGPQTVTVRGLTFLDGYNELGAGGGAISNEAGDLTVTDSTFLDNAAGNNGGAIDSGDTAVAASLTVTNSSFSQNTAETNGGAIDNGDYGYGGSLTVTNSSFSQNTAVHNGGAIDNNDDSASIGSATITDSTLTNDIAGLAGNEIDNDDDDGEYGSVFVAGDVLDGSCQDNNAGPWTNSGYNAAIDNSCLRSGPVGTDATIGADAGDLAPLDSYGGPTQSILLAQGNTAFGLIPHGTSIATGPGSGVTVVCPATDQRGITSAPGQACDAGATQQTAQTTFAAGTGGDNAGAASDSNDCSDASTPCATVEGALDTLAPGGSVQLSGSFPQSQTANVFVSATIGTNSTDASPATIYGSPQDTTGLITILGTGADVTVADLKLENGYNAGIPNGYGGGAVTHNVGGQLTVSDSTLSDNTGENGGAIDNNDATSGASLTIEDSTLTGNSAPDGGAIDNSDNSAGGGPVTIADSTFYDNSGIDGGAVDNDDNHGSGGSVTVTQSTFAGDTGPQIGPEIANSHYDTGGTVYVAADVFAGACTDDSSATGSWTDAGYNAAADASCLGSSPAGSDATVGPGTVELGPFGDNGGPTATLALAPDNSATGLVPHGASFTTGPSNAASVVCPLSADQRGIASPSGAACDAGAIQYSEQALTFGSGIPSSVVIGQSGGTVTASSSAGLAPALSVDAATTNGACTLSGGAVTFVHAGSCTIHVSQSGNQNIAPATINSSPITVAAADTHTALTYSAGALTATVSPIAPGGGTATGTVEFQVGSQIIGTASLSGGSAKLTYTAPANTSQQVTASYDGTADYTASSSAAVSLVGPTPTPPTTTSTTTTPPTTAAPPTPTPTTTRKRAPKPTITARLSSSQPRGHNGWWTAPVKVSFTCHADGATLRRCPHPLMITTSGQGMRAIGKLTTTAGRTGRVVVRGINIDLTRPHIRITGADPREPYSLHAPADSCRATERVSGISHCTITRRTTQTATGYSIRYTTHAKSRAGTTASRTVTVHVSDIALLGAGSHGNETYSVTPGHSYVLEVLSRTQPTYLNAAPSPLGPTPAHRYFAHSGTVAGVPLWRVRIWITPGFARFPEWTIGVRAGGTTRLLGLLT